MDIAQNQNFIKTWLIRGDTHGNFHQMNEQLNNYEPETTAVIILGDFSINFFLNNQEKRAKKELDARGYYIYAVRGNHECRPSELSNIKYIWDENVSGNIWYEEKYPHIRYFKDYGVYNINGYRILILGGAYSVDKQYRLARAGLTEETNIPKKSGWFANEMLTEKEKKQAELLIEDCGYNFDFILSHTCPIKFEPVDMFLSIIDQSKVDKSMEIWLDDIYSKIVANTTNSIPPIWCFGHFHNDRIEAPYVEMYYNDIEKIDTIYERWQRYSKTKELDWWLIKGPKFYV